MAPLSLSHYGLAGNEYSCALIGRDGSIDWLALPYLDSRPHFSALLNERMGGRFQLCPEGGFRSDFSVTEPSPIAELSFETSTGKGRLITWMPPSRPALHRRVETLEGVINWTLQCTPKIEAGSRPALAEKFADGILFRGNRPEQAAFLRGTHRLLATAEQPAAHARFTLKAGEKAEFSWTWGRDGILPEAAFCIPEDESLQGTLAVWKNRQHPCTSSGCIFAGPWHPAIARTTILLQLLQNPWGGLPGASILPGTAEAAQVRFWIRDLPGLLKSLHALGLITQAKTLFQRLTDLIFRDHPEGMQPGYTLDGAHLPWEQEGSALSLLNSNPAHLDVQSQLVLATHTYLELFGELPEGLWPLVRDLVESLCRAWRRPGRGSLHAPQSRTEHFVSSKVFTWAAVDRGCDLYRKFENEAPMRWMEERQILHRTICEQGYDPSQRSFVRSFGDRDLDASNLYLPLLGFLPPDDSRIIGTVDAIGNHLSEGVFIHRTGHHHQPFRTQTNPSFHLSFLYASALARLGRADEASDRLAELCSYANPLGLFPESADLDTGAIGGLFPSLDAHVGLVQTALLLAEARGRQVIAPKPAAVTLKVA